MPVGVTIVQSFSFLPRLVKIVGLHWTRTSLDLGVTFRETGHIGSTTCHIVIIVIITCAHCMSSGPVDVRTMMLPMIIAISFVCIPSTSCFIVTEKDEKGLWWFRDTSNAKFVSRGVDHDGDYCPALKYSPSIVYM